MTDRDNETEALSPTDADRALWRRYAAAAPEAAPEAAPGAEPSAMTLAAYAEGLADAAETAAVEAWLAREPERFDIVAVARQIAAEPPPPYLPAIARAQALVSAPDAGRRFVAPSRRIGLFGAVAASLVAMLLGFQVASVSDETRSGVTFGGLSFGAGVGIEYGFLSNDGESDAGSEL